MHSDPYKNKENIVEVQRKKKVCEHFARVEILTFYSASESTNCLDLPLISLQYSNK